MLPEVGSVSAPTLALVAGTIAAGGAGGYVLTAAIRRRRAEPTDEDFVQLRDTIAGLESVALVVPENPSVDALAASIGLRELCKEWGVAARVFAEGDVTSDDAKAFCNLFNLSLNVADDPLDEYDGAVAVGGGGTVPSFANRPPVVAVVRHRPAAVDHPLVVAGNEAGATSTIVARFIERAGRTPEQDVATALLYGIRAGTREFRRVRSREDFQAASFLQEFADQGTIDALRAPGMSGETFDVIGHAIGNRERRASFAVTNVGSVPSVSALEEAADTLLRLDGVSSAAAFGVHEDTVVTACRADDVRTSAMDVLSTAFDQTEALGGDADTATARVPLGLFSRVSSDQQGTLDELIDASTRKALFSSFEQA
ncbi:DHH family phosphoesterase [Halobacterium bonnevillei]|uniref:Bifunctional oligoribonuclease/PAP phosphatase NrnA n=1 Tax=Halobacterium bonnevillei TaxID=2692200 RepID=A0A6B0SM54_9EURY|nr:bifunctional oligoribonuclease/PAP phosphatase NrnA [Halobacterium bonnevillei]MXR20761.1 bifunctional oligoribonuclease/PAP phosphatase NrnA [Halobacterium bonnevillei]